MAYRLGVDVGGTFTDLMLIDEKSGHTHVAKVASTPKELADMLARETPIWAELIKQSGAKVE